MNYFFCFVSLLLWRVFIYFFILYTLFGTSVIISFVLLHVVISLLKRARVSPPPPPVRAHGLFRTSVSMPISNTVVTRFNCFTLIILCNMSVHSGVRECVDSGHWNGADSATEKGVRPKPLWRRTEGYRTSEHGEGGDCWVSRLNAAKEANDRTNAYMYAGENARQQRKGRE